MNIEVIYHTFKQPERNRDFFHKFCENIEILKYIEDGEKPIIVNNSLQRNECLSILQPIYNFFMNQNSKTMFEYLDSQFMIYMRLLDNILNIDNRNEYTYDLIQDCDIFNQEIAQGLIRLKKTYSGSKELNIKIDSILLTFYDFQEMKLNYMRNLSQIKRTTLSNEI
jgi:hypothetical protein